MKITGGCHCGNLSIEFETEFEPRELPLRACQCTFCRAHGALSTSDPAGRLSIRVVDGRELVRYRFGLRITDFLICRRCGVYVAALTELDGAQYAVINANVLACRGQMDGPIQSMDYDGDTMETRSARRKSRWTPVSALQIP
ncbi:MAG TPA: aldehyde-activating protein [Gammaproteobacteria bacterium]|jgi:hypothetical protein|nr:aldehyde-activating protein [Gammaproteobacteria bacterium]